jgi:hypothetical protein
MKHVGLENQFTGQLAHKRNGLSSEENQGRCLRRVAENSAESKSCKSGEISRYLIKHGRKSVLGI